MAFSARVADEKQEEYLDFVQGAPSPRTGRARTYIIVKRGKMYRLHEEGGDGGSSQTRRQVVTGAIVRRYDPDAGDQEGKPAKFPTPQEAEAYARRWL